MDYSDYDLKHSDHHISSKLHDDSKSSHLIVKFNHGDFYLTASINSGCTPLLKIQFFHDVNEYEKFPREDSLPLGQLVMIPPQNGFFVFSAFGLLTIFQKLQSIFSSQIFFYIIHRIR